MGPADDGAHGRHSRHHHRWHHQIHFDRLSEFQVGEPQIGTLLRQAHVGFRWTVTSLLRKDSLELTARDRDAIAAAVGASEARCVLVTHGTDTMVDTALRLVGVAPEKTIVLTGSMQPATQRDSDAVFNIGFAVGVLRCREAGVWIARNGAVFAPDAVRRNREARRFEAPDR